MEHVGMEQTMSRRKLLAAMGMAGAAAALGGTAFGSAQGKGQQTVTGAVYGGNGRCSNCVEPATIVQIRSGTAPAADTVYYVTDAGQEGLFVYDAADTVSADNTGTMLVSASGARYRRTFDEAASVKWFGAKGDGVADDTNAIQLAIDSCSNVYFPPGDYKIGNPIFLRDRSHIRGTRSAKIFMESNPSGINMLNAKDRRSITIDGLSIAGVAGAGVSFPPAGVMDGQGVTLAIYGCQDVLVTNCYFTRNGEGSGNIYISKCKDVVVSNNMIEKSENGICLDNWYGEDATPGGTHCENITIADNVISDMGGRGIAADLMESAARHTNLTIVGNTIRAAAWAGIQVNARGAAIVGNMVDGKRDSGISTVGGQQSLPTYYGFLSNLGCSNLHLADNVFTEIYQHCVKITRGSNVSIASNRFSFAVSYINRSTLQVVPIHSSAFKMILMDWNPGTSVPPMTIAIDNNLFENDRSPADNQPASDLIYLNDYTNDAAIASEANFQVTNNSFRSKAFGNVIQLYKVNNQKRGRMVISGNNIVSQANRGNGVVALRIEELYVENNRITGVGSGIVMGPVGTIHSEGNTIRNYLSAYKFSLGDLNAEIDQLLIGDTIIGNPGANMYVFNGAAPNSYVVTSSNGAGMKFVNVDLDRVKGTYYPARLVYDQASDTAPAAGCWAVGDKVTIRSAAPGGYAAFVCVTAGNPGVWKRFGAIES
ncbi:hypothetical protein FE783_01140 [Paenibacillus mesophilus]|uniref:right-handed parallel beta-helix repeat-containing protein n=1 Tax=Paenibacillus mesophilus TaxID=2582849 RepID=UPI00110D3528|nr:right-handed parallel beta-helix repeat-containing protein [Paenibacillus mesophilus]TMV52834.1 hypothetical protein FE783_01140 [Paenibacillus mesophilus]